nr:glycoside hydrolase family 15 protein [Gemmatimonadaceae bacterium]
DLALVGNGTIGALVSESAEISWMCVPHFDGDPVFCSLLRGESRPDYDGAYVVELMDMVTTEQLYLADTPILITRFFDRAGGCIQVTDFSPRFELERKPFAPMMLVRKIEPISGKPDVRIRLRPMQRYGAELMAPRRGVITSNDRAGGDHVRYVGDDIVLRLTTNAPVDSIMAEAPFALDHTVTLVLGPDEAVEGSVATVGSEFLERTAAWWRNWVSSLTIPAEWRDPVVRAAITLQLNVSRATGAIIAAMTTSIPEAPNSGRCWDYRYCWLRDSYFVADALQRLGDSATTERYVDFVMRIVDSAQNSHLKPMYTVAGGPIPEERVADDLPGFRDMGPVRVGNQAYHQIQHDVYGEVILAARELFSNGAATTREQTDLFERLETLGDRAAALFDKPDAGLWELRGAERVHTFSSVMCWAACDGLAQIAARLELHDRAMHWRGRAEHIHEVIGRRSWNEKLGAFTAAMDGDTLDASLLLMHSLGFIAADDSRFVASVRAIGRDLRHGEFIYRYVEQDDFGRPENAFLVCTFWYIDALAAIGDRDEAKRLFDNVLSCRNRHGLLAEDLDPETHEQWGNFVQTYSMAGIIDSAIRLSSSPS